jgi:hypothetical protein
MIATVRVFGALVALFLDVHDFPVTRQLEVPADDAATSEGGEPEKPDEAHDELLERM